MSAWMPALGSCAQEAGFHVFYERASGQEAGGVRLGPKAVYNKNKQAKRMRVGSHKGNAIPSLFCSLPIRVCPQGCSRRGDYSSPRTVTCGSVDTTTHTPFWFR